MKVYTLEDLNTFERDEYGRLICPNGDYTHIKSFGEWCSFGKRCSFGEGCSFGKGCSFGEWCSFGERCSFGEWCSFGERCNLDNNLKFENLKDQVDQVLKIDCIGSRKGCTYFFKTLSEIYVRCGCFFGTITKFEGQVKTVHENNAQWLTEYTEAIRYAKIVLQGASK